MQQACAALCECMLQLGVGIDGGKDSLTMSSQVRSDYYLHQCEYKRYSFFM